MTVHYSLNGGPTSCPSAPYFTMTTDDPGRVSCPVCLTEILMDELMGNRDAVVDGREIEQ